MSFRSFIIILISCLSFFISLPTFLGNSLDGYWDEWKIKLGLDLRGGSSLVLGIDVDSVIEEKLGIIKSDIESNFKSYKSIDLDDNKIIVDPLDKTEFLKEFSESSYQSILNISSDSSGKIVLFPTGQMIQETSSLALEQSLAIVRNRVDQSGISDISIQRYGDSSILLQMPGIQDPSSIKSLLGKTAKLDFRLLYPGKISKDEVPAGFINIPLMDNRSEIYTVSKYPVLSGNNLINAQVVYDNGKPVVSIRFDYEGASKFAMITKKNIGKQLAIVIDNEVISAPVINDVITGGNATISGNFTPKSANNLAILLRSGALPAPISILEERTIGPSLGSDSIASGKKASIIAFSIIMIFMVAIYGLVGVIANIGLIVNVFLVISGLVLLNSALTLPGLAGMLLTIDMAVDSNILIFERIREESKKNKDQLVTNINNGYKLAESSIIDSHITTFIVSLILFLLGSGPIKGFAITLILGIFTSIFVSQYLTKMMVLYVCNLTKMRKI